jgi:hypothetical protein
LSLPAGGQAHPRPVQRSRGRSRLWQRSQIATVRLYGLISDQTDTVVDWYMGREEAYIALRGCLSQDPDWEDELFVWADRLRVQPELARSHRGKNGARSAYRRGTAAVQPPSLSADLATRIVASALRLRNWAKDQTETRSQSVRSPRKEFAVSGIGTEGPRSSRRLGGMGVDAPLRPGTDLGPPNTSGLVRLDAAPHSAAGTRTPSHRSDHAGAARAGALRLAGRPRR